MSESFDLTRLDECIEAYNEAAAIARKWIKKYYELEAENERLRAAVEFVASQKDLFFAECSIAEKIVQTCEEALKPNLTN